MKAPTPIDLSAEAVADFKLSLQQSQLMKRLKACLMV